MGCPRRRGQWPGVEDERWKGRAGELASCVAVPGLSHAERRRAEHGIPGPRRHPQTLATHLQHHSADRRLLVAISSPPSAPASPSKLSSLFVQDVRSDEPGTGTVTGTADDYWWAVTFHFLRSRAGAPQCPQGESGEGTARGDSTGRGALAAQVSLSLGGDLETASPQLQDVCCFSPPARCRKQDQGIRLKGCTTGMATIANDQKRGGVGIGGEERR